MTNYFPAQKLAFWDAAVNHDSGVPKALPIAGRDVVILRCRSWSGQSGDFVLLA